MSESTSGFVLNDAREFSQPLLRGPRHFLGFIAPLHGRSDVKRNVAAASHPLAAAAMTPVSLPGVLAPFHRLSPSESKIGTCQGPRRNGAGCLLHFDSRARLGELLLDVLGLFLRDTFLDGLRGAIDQIFGFL